MADFTANARKSWTATGRFSARPLFLLDQMSVIITTQADEPILTQAGHSGTAVTATDRKSWMATDRESWTANARRSWTAKARP